VSSRPGFAVTTGLRLVSFAESSRSATNLEKVLSWFGTRTDIDDLHQAETKLRQDKEERSIFG
jgi:hypothetical protein